MRSDVPTSYWAPGGAAAAPGYRPAIARWPFAETLGLIHGGVGVLDDLVDGLTAVGQDQADTGAAKYRACGIG